MNSNDHKESGLVSIFSVIFFMIFMSVIVVGFIRIMGDEVRQATDNDLTASALISAQSGAEEGKRILLYCANAGLDPSERTRCNNALNQTSCSAAIQQFSNVPAVNLNVDTANNEGIVTQNPNYLQRYTCLSILTQTPSVEDINVPAGTSRLIPLRSVGGFSNLVFSWHDGSLSKDGTASLGTPLTSSSMQEWNAAQRPAMMRLEFIPYARTGAIDLAAMEAGTRTIFLAPGVNSSPSAPVNILTTDNRQNDPNDRAASNINISMCNNTAGRQYYCERNVSLPTTGPNATSTVNYMLRVTSYYRSAHIKMELQNGVSTVNFDNVQPLIDVTGRTNDVFRRIQTRVAFEGDYFMPEFALGTATDICKQMTITDSDATSSNDCSP